MNYIILTAIAIVILTGIVDEMINGILQESNLSDYVYNIDDFRNNRMKYSRYSIIILVTFIFNGDILLTLATFLLAYLALYKKPLYIIKKKRKEDLKTLRYQFPIWLRQIQILLQTNNVTTSLMKSIETAPNLIKEEIVILVNNIQKDPLTIMPYQNFLGGYRLHEIERSMKLLYRYSIIGKDESYMQFNKMISSTSKWLRTSREERNSTKMMIYQWYGMIPLIGVTIMYMAIMFNLIINLFEKGVS